VGVRMASQFTFNVPDSAQYLHNLIVFLKDKRHNNLVKILSVSKCQIWTTELPSFLRSGAKLANIHFQVPLEILSITDSYLKSPFYQEILMYCNTLMPKEVGYDIESYTFTPLADTVIEKSVEDELEEIKREILHSGISLPPEILEKSKEMSEAYMYLYVIENVLRLFIEETLKKALGDSFEQQTIIPPKIKEKIEARKKNESQKKWLSIRGTSFLFYLDFSEIQAIISSNWEHFKNLFPDQEWIAGKLKELYDCRNLIAHNSYIGELERDVIKVNFRSIRKQIS
jgi:hypothetical protein